MSLNYLNRVINGNHSKILLFKNLTILIKQAFSHKIQLIIYKEQYNKHIQRHLI